MEVRGKTAFPLVATALGVVMFASAAPSPLYPVYQRLWGFSSATLTVVFAVYVAALLLSLLTAGTLSDHVGRRPVIAGSLLTLIGAMIVFATADGVGALLAARVLQGLATGVALGTLSAAAVDLQPGRRAGALVASVMPVVGLALGVTVSAVLVQYAPSPRRLVFVLIAAALALLVAAIVAVLPETSPRHGFTIRAMTPRVSVPTEVRQAFAAGVPALIATWALGGLNLSLGSSIIAAQLGVRNTAWDGVLLSAFFFAAAAAAPLASTRRPIRLPASYACLGAGLVLQLAGSLAASIPVYAAGMIIAGVGFSTAYAGVIASVAHVPAHGRSRLFTAIYVVCYVAFSVPALIGGMATDSYGLGRTTTGYTIFVLLMVAIAAARLRSRRPAAPAQDPAPAPVRAEVCAQGSSVAD
jgi:predicted MFS family arabinose efflux permease